MSTILPESLRIRKLKGSFLLVLLLIAFTKSWGQTYISQNQTVNASNIPSGTNIVMQSGSTLNMDVSRSFGTLLGERSTNGASSFTISGTGTASFTSITVNANGGQNGSVLTFEVSANTTVQTSILVTGNGNREKSASILGTLRLSGSGIPISEGWSSFTLGPNSTVEFNGGDQTLFLPTSGIFHNLILSGSGTKTLPLLPDGWTLGGSLTLSGTAKTTLTNDITISGSLTLNANTSLSASSFIISVGQNWTTSGTFNPETSTVVLNGNSASTISASNFNNLSISGAGSKTATGNLTISGNLSLSGILSAGSFSHTLSGNFTNSGTLNPNTSTFIFSKSGDQTLDGPTFFNLVLGGSGNKFFSQSLTIQANLSITGTAIARLGINNSNTNTLKFLDIDQLPGTYGSLVSSASFLSLQFFGNLDVGILTVQNGPAPCTTGTWLGTINSNWNTSSNWCNGLIPNSSTNVSISSTAPNQPVIGTGGGITNNLSIGSGASLTISGPQTLQVFGNWSLNGTFNPGTNSTVEFRGSSNNSINTGSFANLKFEGPGTKTINGILNFSENLEIVSGTVVLTSPNTLTLNQGKSMIIRSSATLTTNGPSSRVIILPQANYINYSASNPRIEVRQLFTGTKGWRMVGTPISSNYAQFSVGLETQGFPGSTNPSLQPNLLWWDETDIGTTLQGWRKPGSATDVMPVGRGHYFYIFNGATKPSPSTENYSDVLPLTQSFTGTEINLSSGFIDFGITFTPRPSSQITAGTSIKVVNQFNEGFNLIANPTASMLDWDASSGWTKSKLDQSIYVWDPATQNFLTWNGTIGTLGSGRIAPFQAFWVKANGSNPILRLNGNGAKTTGNQSFFGRIKDTVSEYPVIHLDLTGENLHAESHISFGEDGVDEIDAKDAFQLEPLSEDWLLLYSYGSSTQKIPLAINHLPSLQKEDKIIPLQLAAAKAGQPFRGSYLLTWDFPSGFPEEYSVVLMDHSAQKAINMKKVSAYAFSFEAPKSINTRLEKSSEFNSVPTPRIFSSPYEIENMEPNSRNSLATPPQRPFTLYISSSSANDQDYLPNYPKLFSPYPNPFSTSSKIRFFLPVSQEAIIQILDSMGNQVGTLGQKTFEAGIHELEWVPNYTHLANGLYIIRLITQDFQANQKLLKIHP